MLDRRPSEPPRIVRRAVFATLILAACAALALACSGGDETSAPSVAPSPTATNTASPPAEPQLRTGQWLTLAQLPAPRQETAVIALDGEIWVLGGFVASGQIVATIEVYDPETDSWRAGPDLPLAMHHANVAVVDGRLFIAGFLTGGFVPDGRVFELDATAGRWIERASMPAETRRGASAVAVLDGGLYVFGGLRGGAVADASVYDPATDRWRTLADVPRPADHLVAGAIDGLIYLAGGRSGGIAAHTAALDAFDPRSGEWSAHMAMPTSRGGTAGAVLDGRLYVFGGEGNRAATSGVFAEVESYDPATDSWQSLPPMPVPRHGTGAAVLGGAIYVPGGATVQALGASDANEALRP